MVLPQDIPSLPTKEWTLENGYLSHWRGKQFERAKVEDITIKDWLATSERSEMKCCALSSSLSGNNRERKKH
jgi:hypothetical protein